MNRTFRQWLLAEGRVTGVRRGVVAGLRIAGLVLLVAAAATMLPGVVD